MLQTPQPAPRRVAIEFTGDHTCHLVDVEAAIPEAGPFQQGSIDLTGDGIDETVFVRGARLQIHVDGRRVWESEPDWRVEDAALGDPNNDGRMEILVAFMKPDSTGEMKSQPFLVGYRRGLFGTWWGGSPIDYPLLEVELADIDGDGRQELIALEKLPQDQQRVGVWRWHGWGFSLIRSTPPGNYSGLTLFDTNHDGLVEPIVFAGS